MAASKDSFGARSTLTVEGTDYDIFRLDAVEGSDKLPFSLKVLLENLLRTEDGADITADHIRAIANWDPSAEPDQEIQFTPARVVMQDFTGVPCIVDLATMREAMAELGGDPQKINPLAPAELVIDHSVIADVFGTPDSFERNVEIEYERNGERYQFLRWGQGAFSDFKVVPPGHRHRAPGQHRAPGPRDLPARRRATASSPTPTPAWAPTRHTTMVNGLGVLGWGVGGIEAEAAMLGQPVSMLIPRVVGFKLTGELPDGATATDLVLTITEMLREHGVVGKFVEFYGAGVSAVPLANRATIGNMSPEFGSTAAMFPIDEETITYLRAHRPQRGAGRAGRGLRQGAGPLARRLARAGVLRVPGARPRARVVPSIAGPKRPQDRVAITEAKAGLPRGAADLRPRRRRRPGRRRGRGLHRRRVGRGDLPGVRPGQPVRARQRRRPASRTTPSPATAAPGRASKPTRVVMEDGTETEVDHGHVVIAAITSCTNTSNPQVMIGAALLAKNAVERGLTSKPWVKTTLAPGSKVVMDYYEKAELTPYLEKLGFYLVGYGCTTCIGNSGPLPEPVQQGGQRGRPRRRLGALGQPQLRGPDQPRRQDELPGLARRWSSPTRWPARWTST